MDFDSVMSYTLRIGVIISIALIILGFILLAQDPTALQRLASRHSIFNTSRVSPIQVLQGLNRFDGVDYILFGLIVLIATPVIRVILGLAGFIAERNKLYIVITFIVLLDLIIAIFIIPFLYK
ncbi:membrane protein [Sulfolobus acidocaldarius SUSAZ]|nr:membrane protein [Sulfolobus acidocaldarius SUSAZ]